METKSVVPTPLAQFKDRIHLAKSVQEAREVLANASSSLDAYSTSTEKRDSYVARLESETDELYREMLIERLRVMKSSDSEARINGHVAGCKVVRAYIAHLEAMYCDAGAWMTLDEEGISAKLNGLRDIIANNPKMFVTK